MAWLIWTRYPLLSNPIILASKVLHSHFLSHNLLYNLKNIIYDILTRVLGYKGTFSSYYIAVQSLYKCCIAYVTKNGFLFNLFYNNQMLFYWLCSICYNRLYYVLHNILYIYNTCDMLILGTEHIVYDYIIAAYSLWKVICHRNGHTWPSSSSFKLLANKRFPCPVPRVPTATIRPCSNAKIQQLLC